MSPRSIVGRRHSFQRVTIDTLSDFVARLDQSGELLRVTHPVSVDLELCEIADRVMKQPGGGKALLFEHPILMDGTRSAFPVGINLFGSMRRMSMSLGVESLDEVGARITGLLEMKVPEGIVGKLSLLPRLLEVGKFPPRMRRGDAPSGRTCQRPSRPGCGQGESGARRGSPSQPKGGPSRQEVARRASSR